MVLKLPAVSGSSGRLVISAAPSDTPKPSAPGLVFADASLDYTEAMRQFVAASPDAQGHAPAREQSTAAAERSQRKAQRKAWRREANALRVARQRQRARRRVEDRAWRVLREQIRAADMTAPAPSRTAALKRKRLLRLPRRAQLRKRARQDERWHERRRQLRAKLSAFPLVRSWIDVLVITDNCTRQCLGLPVFVSGPKVTAELIMAALQVLLPPELQFLISDRGTHFVAKAFQSLKPNPEFIHVLIARHRPQSNGIAERFVRTLKEWLATHPWQTAAELETLLAQFKLEYNDRPHRGLAMPGLSPNEFANRCWLE